MKNRFLGALGIVFTLVLSACDRTAEVLRASAARAVFHVEGMTCGGCEAGVKIALEKLPGVSEAEVAHKASRASVVYDPARVRVPQMQAAIEALGYRASLRPGAS